MPQFFLGHPAKPLFFIQTDSGKGIAKPAVSLTPIIKNQRLTMNCPECKAPNDEDAFFCTACGKSLVAQRGSASRQRRVYFIILLFIPVVIIAGAIGYYKYYLPGGIAAVVNGEEIRVSELDAAVDRMRVSGGTATDGLRYQALQELISERLVVQEARKAGIEVTRDALLQAAAGAQAASGLNEAAFNQAVSAQYGSRGGFENELKRRIMINRLIAERVVPPGTDPGTAGRLVNQWLQNLSARATVRIALAEQLAGPGCRCSNNSVGEAGMSRGKQGCPAGGAGATQAPDRNQEAVDAALRYWHAKHGPDPVTAKSADFGCHVQVDIIRDEKIIGSLRYQGGSILEQ